jgi:hypothetical protein
MKQLERWICTNVLREKQKKKKSFPEPRSQVDVDRGVGFQKKKKKKKFFFPCEQVTNGCSRRESHASTPTNDQSTAHAFRCASGFTD